MREGRVPSRPWYEQRGVPPQGSRQLEVRIRQPASKEGRQERRRCSKRVVQVKIEVPPHKLRGRPYRATYCVAWSQNVRLRAGWAETQYATWACTVSTPQPKPTRTWHQRLEC